MIRKLPILAIFLAGTLPLFAQNWSIGAGTGAFVFGDFVERRTRTVAGSTSNTRTVTLSAATRAGLVVDIERSFSGRFAMRLEGTFTRAPLVIKEQGDEKLRLEAGDLDVMVLKLPLIFRINRGGALRFHLMAGPAHAIYRAAGRENVDSTVTVFDGTRNEWGATAGAGVAWYLSDRFAIEGQISDTVTASPFHREDFPDVPGFKIPEPHNVHTSVGLRWRF